MATDTAAHCGNGNHVSEPRRVHQHASTARLARDLVAVLQHLYSIAEHTDKARTQDQQTVARWISG